MEILRVPPYNLSVTVEVANASYEYDVDITDMSDSSVSTITLVSNSDAVLEIPLSSTYDTSYTISVDGEEHYVDVTRPYVDPNTKGDTASDIASYAKDERLARAIIDSVSDEDFYFRKVVIETVGLGADYLPLWVNATKVLKVYENNILVYDAENPELYQRTFGISKDNSGIIQDASGSINRSQGASILIPMAASDNDVITYFTKSFTREYDYVIVVEAGYKRVPRDIVEATELLVDDIACGKLDYYKRYISEYNTDQFRLKFDGKVFDGTGNILVDKILSKYSKPIKKLGVL